MYGAPAGVGRGVGRGMATGHGREMATGRGMAIGHNTGGAMNTEEETLDRPSAQVPQEQRTTQYDFSMIYIV